MVMIAEIVAAGVALLVAGGELLHARRSRHLARLAFGPAGRPGPIGQFSGIIRIASAALLAWGLTTLLIQPPKIRRAEQVPNDERRHLVVVLDVSPSMRLEDAGVEGDQPRMRRAAEVLGSVFKRAQMDQYLVSVIACYTSAIPVVEETKDLDVVRNILSDLPMHHAFSPGKTDLFQGLEEAARLAQPWVPRTASMIILTDGDTVPATGMPTMPASISEVLVLGIGDPRTGSFIDGGQSRQDASTLRQVAARIDGVYHDANERHVPTDLVTRLTLIPETSPFERLTRREYALMATAIGALGLGFLPVLLHYAGTRWQPGVRIADQPIRWRSRERSNRTEPPLPSSPNREPIGSVR